MDRSFDLTLLANSPDTVSHGVVTFSAMRFAAHASSMMLIAEEIVCIPSNRLAGRNHESKPRSTTVQ